MGRSFDSCAIGLRLPSSILAALARPANKVGTLRVDLGVDLAILDDVGHHEPRVDGGHGRLVDGCARQGALQDRVLDALRGTFANGKYGGELDVAKPNRSRFLHR